MRAPSAEEQVQRLHWQWPLRRSPARPLLCACTSGRGKCAKTVAATVSVTKTVEAKASASTSDRGAREMTVTAAVSVQTAK